MSNIVIRMTLTVPEEELDVFVCGSDTYNGTIQEKTKHLHAWIYDMVREQLSARLRDYHFTRVLRMKPKTSVRLCTDFSEGQSDEATKT